MVINPSRKKKQGSATYSTDRENEFSKIFVMRNRDEQVIYHNSGFTKRGKVSI